MKSTLLKTVINTLYVRHGIDTDIYSDTELKKIAALFVIIHKLISRKLGGK